jgi:signal peptide peptidase SppA
MLMPEVFDLNPAPWALVPEVLSGMVAWTPATREQPEAEAMRVAQQSAIAFLPVQGVLTQRGDYRTTSTDGLHAAFNALADDPTVGAIVLDIDSPGGSVGGIMEFAESILAARERKPVVAAVNGTAASGAYWIASAADKIVASPSSLVGSIGVYATHFDTSKLMDRMGVRPTLISAGKYKVEGNPFEPLGDEARAAMQEQVDLYYQHFVRSVAQGRRVAEARVESQFGQGRVVQATQGAERGMVDKVGRMPAVLAAIRSSARRSKAVAIQRLRFLAM